MIVSRYGIHWAPGDIPFLVQGIQAQNPVSPDLDSPFAVRTQPRYMRCPHAIDLNAPEPEPDWLKDPLAQIFLPLRRADGERPQLLVDPDRKHSQLLMQLCRLSSPTMPMLQPIWWREPDGIAKSYRVTDLGPIVIMDGTGRGMKDVFRHINLAESYNRRLLVVTRERLPLFEVDQISTELTDVSHEPLEGIGAGVLREYMLHAKPT